MVGGVIGPDTRGPFRALPFAPPEACRTRFARYEPDPCPCCNTPPYGDVPFSGVKGTKVPFSVKALSLFGVPCVNTSVDFLPNYLFPRAFVLRWRLHSAPIKCPP